MEKQPEEIKNSDSSSSLSNSSRNKSNNNSNVPWKVKLAKKKVERSQTTTRLDGQVSVDLRKSINHLRNPQIDGRHPSGSGWQNHLAAGFIQIENVGAVVLSAAETKIAGRIVRAQVAETF